MAGERADVVVIGGGMLGMSAGFALGRAGLAVHVLDHGATDAASRNSFAWFNATSKLTDEHYHRLNAAGIEVHRELAEAFSEAAGAHHPVGEIQWAVPEIADSVAELEKRAARLEQFGYPVRRLARDDLARLEPNMTFPDGAAGLFAEIDGWLDAPRLIAFLAARIRGAGGVVDEHRPVTGVRRENGALVAVETYDGPIATEKVVVAAGIATPALARLAVGGDAPYLPVDAISSLLADAPPDLAGGLVSHVMHAPGADGLHFRPSPDGGLLICAEDTKDMLAEAPAHGPYREQARILLERLARVIPSLPVEALVARTRARIGTRPMPGDGYSIVGALAADPAVYVAVTHSGVTLGPLLGRLIAEEIVSGDVPELLQPYRPERFQQG